MRCKILGDRVKELRIKLGYTQRELVNLCHEKGYYCGDSAISYIETRRTNTMIDVNLEILSSILECDPQYICGITDNKNNIKSDLFNSMTDENKYTLHVYDKDDKYDSIEFIITMGNESSLHTQNVLDVIVKVKDLTKKFVIFKIDKISINKNINKKMDVYINLIKEFFNLTNDYFIYYKDKTGSLKYQYN